jgi:hypothetical protein
MPRPSILDNPKKEIACALARAGMTGRWIAAFFGCDESTLRYALERDESFRLRFDQARALMFLDHLTHIASAASKSWRASAWLLERAFPEECNPRHRTAPPPDESFDGEPTASTQDEQQSTVNQNTSTDPPSSPADDSPQAPLPPMDVTSFQTAALVKMVYNLRRSTAAVCPDTNPDPLQLFGEILPPRNHSPLRERIYAENLQGFQIDQAIDEENRKEQAERAARSMYRFSDERNPAAIRVGDMPAPAWDQHPTAHAPSHALHTRQPTAKQNSFANVPQLHTHYP